MQVYDVHDCLCYDFLNLFVWVIEAFVPYRRIRLSIGLKIIPFWGNLYSNFGLMLCLIILKRVIDMCRNAIEWLMVYNLLIFIRKQNLYLYRKTI